MPASATISLTTGQPLLSNGGNSVTIDFTFTCDFDGAYQVEGWLVQQLGPTRVIAEGTDWQGGSCSAGEVVITSLVFTSQDSAFKAGPPIQLDAYVSLHGDDGIQYDDVFLNTTIRVKK